MRRRHLLLSALSLPALGLPGRLWARPVLGLVVHDSPKPVPSLDIRDADGKPAGLDTLTGQAIVLNLWATWCVPCRAELPSLDRLAEAVSGKGVAVVALSLDRMGAPIVRSAYASLGIKTLPIRLDRELRAGELLSASMLPITLLIDAKGREVARYIGPTAWDGKEGRALIGALASGQPITPAMAPPPGK